MTQLHEALETNLILAERYAALQGAFAGQTQAATTTDKEEDKIEDPAKKLLTDNKSIISTGTKIQGKLDEDDDGHHTPSDEKEKDKSETKKDKQPEEKKVSNGN